MAGKIVDEGLTFLFQCAMSEEVVPPANFYLGLATDVSLADDASLAGVTELTGTGYARQEIPSSAVGWTVGAGGTYDIEADGTQETFTATDDDWDDAKIWFLATTVNDTGKLIAWAPLSETRSLLNGDSLKVTPTLGLNVGT
jgi:hypothetical protein